MPRPTLTRPFSLTCRRRHVKCDEGKPRCGPCVRISAVCAYSRPSKATRRATRQSLDPSGHDEATSSRPASASDTRQNEGDQGNKDNTLSATGQVSASSGDDLEELQPSERTQEGEDEQQARESGPLPPQAADDGLNACQGYSMLEGVLEPNTRNPALSSTNQGDATSWQMRCEAIASSGTSLDLQNRYRTDTFPDSHPLGHEMLSPTQAALQTTAFAYHSTPDSGASHGTGSLTLRWLDLLIGDATVNYGPLPELDIDPGGANVFGNSVPETPASLNGAATPAPNDRQAADAGATTQNSYLQERLHDHGGPSGDKQLWQASEAMSLQPQEHILFRHFTEHISRWVSIVLSNSTRPSFGSRSDLERHFTDSSLSASDGPLRTAETVWNSSPSPCCMFPFLPKVCLQGPN